MVQNVRVKSNARLPSCDKKTAVCTGRLDLKFMEENSKVVHFCEGAENLALGKVVQKYLQHFEIWCCIRTEKIGWTDRVRNEGVSPK
jgi:hypothetical protein